ncbi:RHS repeat protein, partial [Aureivirga marina]|uniref:RHS repeat protein n=1 Tax=Aureivirga marina TaxID=1182451 RepID=UPI0018C8E401
MKDKFYFKKVGILYLLICFLSLGSYAQINVDSSEVVYTWDELVNDIGDQTISIENKTIIGGYQNMDQFGSTLLLHFYLEDIASVKSPIQATINFETSTFTHLFGENVSQDYTPEPFELVYDPTNTEAEQKEEIVLRFEDVFGLELNLGDLVTTTEYSDRLRLKISFTSKGYSEVPLDLNTSSYGSISVVYPSVSVTEGALVSENKIGFYFKEIAGAKSYEIEWTYVDNYKIDDVDYNSSYSASTIDFTKDDFNRNSTRVSVDRSYLRKNGTSSSSRLVYQIPMTFKRGYIIARYRGVGIWEENPDKLKYTDWISLSGNTNPQHVSDWGKLYISEAMAHENRKNWQSQTSFAEDGKQKTVVKYADGSMRSRQTVTRINTSNNIVVGETIYDVEGRPAVSILPVPVNDSQIKYQNNFNKNSNEKSFSYKDFEQVDTSSEDCEVEISGLYTDSGAAKYYSPNNDMDPSKEYNKMIPDSRKDGTGKEGYPFIQTKYTSDNTGRIDKRGGVGYTYQLGNEHETVYLYGVPTKEELTRLFGVSEVGNIKRYQKNSVIDPNGQISVTYVDPYGRTIATALSGVPSNQNLLPLEDTSNIGAIEHNLLGKEHPDDTDTALDLNEKYTSGYFGNLVDGLNHNSVKIVTVKGESQGLGYEFRNSFYTDDCAVGVKYPFVYDLRISVLDDCGVEQTGTDSGFTTQIGDVNQASEVSYSKSFEFELPVGEYNISKTLKVNEVALEQLADKYIAYLKENEGSEEFGPFCVFREPDFGFADCFTSCEECVDALGGESDYIQAELSEYTDLTSAEQTYLVEQLKDEYLLLIEACNKPCEESDSVFSNDIDVSQGGAVSTIACELSLESLTSDMSPSGKYGLFETNSTIFDVSDIEDQASNPTGPDVADSAEDTEQIFLNIFRDRAESQFPDLRGYGEDISWRYPRWYEADDNTTTENHYYDLDQSTISKVRIKKNADGSYTPAILAQDGELGSFTIEPDPYDSAYYFIEPQFLANVDDFLSEWKSSWSLSLIKYHPEFRFFEFELGLCGLRKEVTIGEATYDYSPSSYLNFLNTVNTYEDALSYGLLSSPFKLMEQDPFFSGTLPNIPAGLELNHINLIKEGYNDPSVNGNGYQGTEVSMLWQAYQLATCNNIDCDFSTQSLSNAQILADIQTGDYTEEQKDAFWHHYRGNYASLRNTIQTIATHLYAYSFDGHNRCIGELPESTDLTSPLSKYANKYPLPSITNENGITPLCNLPQDIKDALATKDKVYHQIDNLYDSSEDSENPNADSELYQEIKDQADYAYFQETGKCPKSRDLEVFLNGFFDWKSPNINENTKYTGNYLTPDLLIDFITSSIGNNDNSSLENYEDLAGFVTPLWLNSTVVDLNNRVLDLEFFKGSIINSNIEPVRLILPEGGDGLTWDTYGSVWTIDSFKHLYYDGFEYVSGVPAAKPFHFKVIAVITINGVSTEVLLEGATKGKIGECHGSSTDSEVITHGDDLSDGGVSYYDCEENPDDCPCLAEDNDLDVWDGEEVKTYRYVCKTGILETEGFPTSTHKMLQEIFNNYQNNVPIIYNNYPEIKAFEIENNIIDIIQSKIESTINSVITTDYTVSFDFDIIVTSSSVKVVRNATITTNNDTWTIPFSYNLLESDGVSFPSIDLTDVTGLDGNHVVLYTAGDNYEVYQVIDFIIDGEVVTNDEFKTSITITEDVGICIEDGEIIRFNPNVYGTKTKLRDCVSIGQFYYLSTQTEGYFTFHQDCEAVYHENISTLARTSSSRLAIPDPADEEEEEDCDCLPVATEPIACSEEVYKTYLNIYTDFIRYNPDNAPYEPYSYEHFCSNNFAYNLLSYKNYIESFNIDSIDHPLFISISEFSATALGVGYVELVNGELITLQTKVDEYTSLTKGILYNEGILAFTLGEFPQEYQSWHNFISSYVSDQSEIRDMCISGIKVSVDPEIEVEMEVPCYNLKYELSQTYTQLAKDRFYEEKRFEFIQNYLEAAVDNSVENFIFKAGDQEYQYTLYHYDRAGNLVRTTPPEGVKLREQPYNLETTYKYNSLNQLVWQSTPDGG